MTQQAIMQLALSMKSAAAALDSTQSFVKKEVREGRIAARKMGNRTIILASEIQRYLSELPERTAAKKVHGAALGKRRANGVQAAA